MDTHSVRKDVKKEDFMREGFQYCSFNVLKRQTCLYKNLIIMIIIIDFTKEDVPIHVEVVDSSTGQFYPMNCEYGINEVRDKVKQKYTRVMDDLTKKCLFKKEKEKVNK